MSVDDKLKQVREWMTRENLDALVVPTDDPHGSEYLAEHWQCRKWLTGFTGSAGTCVVTLNSAGLWTDGRYFLQAEKELEGLKKHIGTHAAGVVISSLELSEIIPTMKSGSDYLTGYTMNELEELGLIKMDFLSIKNL